MAFRLRRYRVFVVCAVISVLAFVHFSGLRQLDSAPAPVNIQNTVPQTPAKDDHQKSHGDEFAKPPAKLPETPTVTPHVPPPPSPVNSHAGDDDATKPKPAPPPTRPETGHGNAKEQPERTPLPLPKRPTVVSDDYGQGGQGRVELVNQDPKKPPTRWSRPPVHFPISSTAIIPLPTGKPKPIPKIQFDFQPESEEQKRSREKNLALIKRAFKHAWDGYRKNAMGHDEVRPVGGEPRDPFMGWGATLVDSLDTLWIMGLKDEFEEAVEATKKIDFHMSNRTDIPLFETVIRYMGGLIGAYDVSGQKYKVLLDKAVELTEVLMGAFDTPNRMPITYYKWTPEGTAEPRRARDRVVLAELGSLSVEFTRLAQITGDNRYYDAIARITNELEKWQNGTKLPGLWPAHLDASGCKKIPIKEDESGDGNSSSEPATVPKPGLPNRAVGKRDVPAKDQKDPIFEDAEPADYDSKPTGKPLVAKPKVKPRPTGNLPPGVLFGKSSKFECEEQGLTSPPDTFMDRFTLAALADSTYEYLPKEYMLLGGQNEQYRTMYEKAMDTAREYLLFRPMLPDNNDVRFFAQVMASEATTNKSALNYRYEGSHLGCFTGGMLGIGAKIFGLEGDLSLAKKLTEGCVWAYGATTTGIMPETFTMLPCESMETCKWNETRYYDVIDPFAAIREQSLKALEAQLADSGTPRKDHVESPLSTLIPKLPEEGIPLITRDIDVPMPGELTLSKPPSGDEPEASGEFAPAKPLTHEQVAEKRIKEERIPRGMAELSSRLYILRPEAIESVFIMYRITGDEHWRQKGWQMFTSIERSTWTQLANSAIRDVTSEVPQYTDEMESFWLGETLKYFYLLFSEPSVVSLDEYVFNTEAHPLKRPVS